jgi:hypothetical protein
LHAFTNAATAPTTTALLPIPSSASIAAVIISATAPTITVSSTGFLCPPCFLRLHLSPSSP